MKKTLLALLVAGAAASAQAGIQVDTSTISTTGPGYDNASGSELVLVAYNTDGISYMKDLGTTMGSFNLNSNFSQSVGSSSAATQLLASIASNQSKWSWGVLAVDRDYAASNPALSGYRVWGTASFDNSATDATTLQLTNGLVEGSATRIQNMMNSYNTIVNPQAATDVNGHQGTANSVNSDSYITLLASSPASGNISKYLNGSDISHGWVFGNALNAIGTNAYFELASQINDTADIADFTPDNTGAFSQAAGIWKLNASGLLTYSVPTAATPIPAAVWLLGSGLVGLVGVSRRREENQA